MKHIKLFEGFINESVDLKPNDTVDLSKYKKIDLDFLAEIKDDYAFIFSTKKNSNVFYSYLLASGPKKDKAFYHSFPSDSSYGTFEKDDKDVDLYVPIKGNLTYNGVDFNKFFDKLEQDLHKFCSDTFKASISKSKPTDGLYGTRDKAFNRGASFNEGYLYAYSISWDFKEVRANIYRRYESYSGTGYLAGNRREPAYIEKTELANMVKQLEDFLKNYIK